MAMKHRHALDDWVGEVHDDVNGSAKRNVHGIQPCRMRKRNAILRVGEEVRLVYVERMQFGSPIDNTPMLISTYAHACHWTLIHRKLAAVDVKGILVLGEDGSEARSNLLERLNLL